MNGIFVAMMVTNCTFDSSGRLDMNSTCCATWFTSMRGSCISCPCGCICPAVERAFAWGRVGHVGLHPQRTAGGLHAGGLPQHLLASPGQRARPAVVHQSRRRRPADAAARPGDDGETVCHGVSPPMILLARC